VDAGIRLRAAIGLAVAARHPAPPVIPRHFPEGLGPGQWRPTPPFLVNGFAGDAKPFLFESAAEVRGPSSPHYPSGHAADCATGAQLLGRVFGNSRGTVAYSAVDLRTPVTRRFPDFAAVASECAESRIWAGAHFRAANEEGRRIGAVIARRALESVPSLAR
jgi:membrane-associated phospholipid phosphatase